MLIQHGDVLLEKVGEIPEAAKTVCTPDGDGRIIVAEGEETGHAHALLGNAEGLQLRDQLFLRVNETAQLVHEEHNELVIPPGNYSVRKVLMHDYERQAIRTVAD